MYCNLYGLKLSVQYEIILNTTFNRSLSLETMFSFGKPPPVNYDDGGNDPDSVEMTPVGWRSGLFKSSE